MNVSLRPLEDGDLDAIYQQVSDPESVRMTAFTAEDQTDRHALLNRMSRVRYWRKLGFDASASTATSHPVVASASASQPTSRAGLQHRRAEHHRDSARR
jgi:hypothetical protein